MEFDRMVFEKKNGHVMIGYVQSEQEPMGIDVHWEATNSSQPVKICFCPSVGDWNDIGWSGTFGTFGEPIPTFKTFQEAVDYVTLEVGYDVGGYTTKEAEVA